MPLRGDQNKGKASEADVTVLPHSFRVARVAEPVMVPRAETPLAHPLISTQRRSF